MYLAGIDIYDIMKVTGHSSLKMLKKYIKADSLKWWRHMEKRGSGLRKIQDATAMLPSYKESELPYFESSREFFYTTLLNVNYGMTEKDFEDLVEEQKNEDSKLTQKTHPEAGKIPQKTPPETGEITQKKIGKTAQGVIDAIVGDSKITRAELAVLLDRSEDTIKFHLARLQKLGILERIGSDRSGFWKIHFKK